MSDDHQRSDLTLVIDNEDKILDPDRLIHELNLLRIEGYYFCFDPKQISNTEDIHITEFIKTNEGIIEAVASIRPNPKYGRPGTLAYKIHHAVLKQYSQYHFPVPEAVGFSQRELSKATGRKKYGGSDKEEFLLATRQLLDTGIDAYLYDKETGKWKLYLMKLYDSALLSGKDNEITECVFQINSHIRKSLNDHHFFCLNSNRFEFLPTITIALYKQIFNNLSYIYSQRKNKNFSYTKDYATICKKWLGGLTVHKFKSKIINAQLGVHFKHLIASELIKKMPEIEKNKKGNGFNIVFHPGKGFFEDYHRFYCNNQLELDFDKAVDDHNRIKPFDLVNYYHCQKIGVEQLDIVFDQKEIDFARELLDKHSYDLLIKFVDYALAEAKRTNFTLYNFKAAYTTYKVEFFANEQKRKEAKQQRIKEEEALKAKKIADRKEQELKAKYDEYADSEIEKYRASLTIEELRKIESDLLNKNPHAVTLIDMQVEFELKKRAGIPDFEDWKKS